MTPEKIPAAEPETPSITPDNPFILSLLSSGTNKVTKVGVTIFLMLPAKMAMRFKVIKIHICGWLRC